MIAEHLASASETEEFVDRWRSPGERRSKVWEERFGETRYLPLGERAFQAALKEAELSPDQVDHLIVTGLHARAATALANRLGVAGENVVDTLTATVGNTGAAHPGLLLTGVLETAAAGQGHRARGARRRRRRRPVAHHRSDLVVPPGAGTRRPGRRRRTRDLRQVPRVAQDAAGRAAPPSRAAEGRRRRRPAGPSTGSSASSAAAIPSRARRSCRRCRAAPIAQPMADVPGTIVTFTVDRLAYSESPPIIFAVVDFDGGGRLPIELTDVSESDVAPGVRVEMTFRKLFTSDDIHNYFWKARLVRGAADGIPRHS